MDPVSHIDHLFESEHFLLLLGNCSFILLINVLLVDLKKQNRDVCYLAMQYIKSPHLLLSIGLVCFDSL